MNKILLSLILALPTAAGFKNTTQVVPLKFGQESATIVFETTGEEIEEAEPHCDCTKVQVKGTRLTAVVDTRPSTAMWRKPSQPKRKKAGK